MVAVICDRRETVLERKDVGFNAPLFLPREFHGQRGLAGYSQESDTTDCVTNSPFPHGKSTAPHFHMEKVGIQKLGAALGRDGGGVGGLQAGSSGWLQSRPTPTSWELLLPAPLSSQGRPCTR